MSLTCNHAAHRSLAFAGFLLGVLLAGPAAGPAGARVIWVNPKSTGKPQDGSTFSKGTHTIAGAMVQAAPGDSIWVSKGTYSENVALTTMLTLLGGFDGTETSAKQRNPAANTTVIDGQNLRACILVPPDLFSVTIDGFTLRNGEGTTTGASVNRKGGGIAAEGVSEITITHCVFQNNDIRGDANTWGGAIYYKGPVNAIGAKITDNVFTGNHAYSGGAITLDGGNAEIRRNTFQNNSAIHGGAIDVGGLGACIITDNAFTTNSADTAGALNILGGAGSQVLRNTFTNNVAYNGGAMAVAFSPGTLVAYNAFRDNTALTDARGLRGAGGAINAYNAQDVIVANNAFFRNRALKADNTGAHGGGISAGEATLVNNTIVASVGAALYYSGPGVVSGNILAFNDKGVELGTGGTMGPLRNNNVFGNTQGNYVNTPDATGSNGNISQDPRFVDAATGDLHLCAGSPCLDAGNSADANAIPLLTDMDGEARVNGPAVDIGADEFHPGLAFTTQVGTSGAGELLAPQPVVSLVDRAGTVVTGFSGPVTVSIVPGTGAPGAFLSGTVTMNAVNGSAAFTDLSIALASTWYRLRAESPGLPPVDSALFNVLLFRVRVRPDGSDAADGATWATALATISAGITAVAGQDAEVWVAAGTYRETVAVPSGVALYGGFAGNETARDQRNPLANVTTIQPMEGPAVKFSNSDLNGVDGFTLTGGTGEPMSDGSNVPVPMGGAVFSFGSSPRIVGNVIKGNTAKYGGGIAAIDGSPTILRNVINGNSASLGGGIAALAGSPAILRNVVTDNEAWAPERVVGEGGGVYLEATTNARVANNLIARNRLGGGSVIAWPGSGSAIRVVGGTGSIRNNTVVANTSDRDHASLDLFNTTLSIDNNILANPAAIAASISTLTVFHNDYVPGKQVSSEYQFPSGVNGNISVAPVFVNEAGGDYHLPAGSPLIDAGYNAAVPDGDLDFDGDARITGPAVDIGFDETGATPVTMADAALAVRAAGGLASVDASVLARLDVEPPAQLDFLDAVRLARKAAGLDPNP